MIKGPLGYVVVNQLSGERPLYSIAILFEQSKVAVNYISCQKIDQRSYNRNI